jgi:hypothetical protein
MSDLRVKIRRFTWHEPVETKSGAKGLRERSANFGDLVDTDHVDAERVRVGLDRGWLEEPSDEQEQEQNGNGTGEIAPEDMDVAQLADYIKGNNQTGRALTANACLQLVGDDPEFAQRMLEAENKATGGMPRRGLVEGLRNIIGSD